MVTEIQTRIAALIAAHAYFAGITPITEKAGDIDTAIETALGHLGFAVEVASASGDVVDPDKASRKTVFFREVTKVSVIHNPTLNTTKNIVEGWEAVVAAVHGQPLVAGGKGPCWFCCLGHDPVPNADGHAEHSVLFRVISSLDTTYTA
jgi:hypothetical protein